MNSYQIRQALHQPGVRHIPVQADPPNVALASRPLWRERLAPVANDDLTVTIDNRKSAIHKGGLMSKLERVREIVRDSLTTEYLKQKTDAGWRLVAVEWQREVEAEVEQQPEFIEDVPFGLRVAADCQHLEEDPTERDILVLMMDLIVQDQPLSRVADGLNQAGFRTRQGSPWSPVSVFNMLPRLIEVGPHIFSSEEWMARRERLMRVV